MAIRNVRAISVFLLYAPLICGQTNAGALTVTASRAFGRASAAKPDQAIFRIDVTSPLNADLNDILSALAGSGVTGDGLASVSTLEILSSDGRNCVPSLGWSFTLTVPLATFKDTASQLAAVQQKFGQKIPGAVMGYGLQGFAVSPHRRRRWSVRCKTSSPTHVPRPKNSPMQQARP